jgi:16S rRNA (guanine(966)-N(2))-methyltransferase RsmD
MRIIAGTLKNRIFKSPKGKGTRPALALIRRMIFDTIQPLVTDSEILDLFAGSGAFVFEGISRGAKKATAIDLDTKVVSLLKSNAENLGISNLIEAYSSDALKAIPQLAQSKKRFDLIFVAPPYFKELTQKSLKLLDKTQLCIENGIIIAQLHKKEEMDLNLSNLALVKTKKHGITIIQFYRYTRN